MSIEHTPPTHDGETGQNHAERPSADFDRVHSLCEILEPAFEQIENGTPLEDAPLRDKLTELTVLLAELHPADVADVLESLPPRERNIVWLLVKPEDDGEVLLEVSDAVRETLIESMDKDELLAAVDDLDADELAELADDLPHQVVYEPYRRAMRKSAPKSRRQCRMKTTKSVRLWTSSWSASAPMSPAKWCCVICAASTACPTIPTRFLSSMKTTCCRACCPSANFWSPIPKIWWKT